MYNFKDKKNAYDFINTTYTIDDNGDLLKRCGKNINEREMLQKAKKWIITIAVFLINKIEE